MASFLTYYVSVLAIISLTEGITRCLKRSACSCMGDNGLIDLSPLTANGGPKFKNVESVTGDTFSWNPCKPFTQGACRNAAACQGQGTNFFNIGSQDSARFEVTPKGVVILSYTADTFLKKGQVGFVRTTFITLVCDTQVEGELLANGESPAGSGRYLMTLNSKYACESSGGGGGMTQCLKTSPCSCMGNKGLVDLTPLATIGEPRFQDVNAVTGDKFSWNPCAAFTEGGCQNVAACQIQGGTQFFNLGSQDSARFAVKSGGFLTLSYSADVFFKRTANITLICDRHEEGRLQAAGESPAGSGNYYLTLNSKYACQQNGGGGTVTVTGTLFVGSFLVIVQMFI